MSHKIMRSLPGIESEEMGSGVAFSVTWITRMGEERKENRYAALSRNNLAKQTREGNEKKERNVNLLKEVDDSE